MSNKPKYKFRLYVAGNSPSSMQAKANLSALCQTHLADSYEIEVVDVQKEPTVALKDSVFITPSLVILLPTPIRKIVGSLSQMEPVLNIILDGPSSLKTPE